MHDTKVMMCTKYVNETFAHITVDTALNGVVNGGDAALYFEKNIEQPFRISIEMFPMGDEHIVAYGLVAVIHCLLKGRYVLW